MAVVVVTTQAYVEVGQCPVCRLQWVIFTEMDDMHWHEQFAHPDGPHYITVCSRLNPEILVPGLLPFDLGI